MYKFTALQQNLLRTCNPDYLAILGNVVDEAAKKSLQAVIAARKTAKSTGTQDDFERYNQTLAFLAPKPDITK